ncbi:MAG TPA: molybdopterin-dependent oxidoreductase, partial [Longimicrobiales bacterium]
MRRREFIKVGTGSALGAGLLGGLTSDWYGLYASEVHDPGTDGTRIVPSFCELCFWKCGIRAHVKDGRVTKITGNPNDPLSNGMLCPRGLGGTGLLYDPDRLKKPMVRVGSRGGDRFEEVSWDTALDEAAARMNRIKAAYGASALALYSHGYGGSWFKHLFHAYGSNNITAPSYAQCRGPRDVGFSLTYGSIVGSPEVTDMAHSRAIALIGSHLGENMHNTQVQDFAGAIRNGADIIVVDPRFSTAASKARYWLPIKPGTDLALLLAWMNVLITEELYDRSYVEKYAYGFDQLKTHVQPFTPEWAYPRTGIEPEKIRATAHLLAGARPASLVHPGRHVTWYGDDTQRSRAIAILNALLGSWGRRGGFYLPASMEIPAYPGLPAYPSTEAASAPTREPATSQPAPPKFPLADEVLAQGVCDASISTDVRAADIKGWMVYGSNLPSTLPDPKRTYKALQELEAVVTIDVLPMEIVGWSDVVLPEATYLERWDDLNAPLYRQPYVALRQAAVEPMYESRPGWWIAKELGQRLGLAQYFPWKDAESFV